MHLRKMNTVVEWFRYILRVGRYTVSWGLSTAIKSIFIKLYLGHLWLAEHSEIPNEYYYKV